MLSAPRPSEAARFAGHILSIIASTIFELGTLGLVFDAADAPVLFVFVRVRLAEAVVADAPPFLEGDVTPFLPIVNECYRFDFVFDAVLPVVEDKEEAVLPLFLLNLPFYS